MIGYILPALPVAVLAASCIYCAAMLWKAHTAPAPEYSDEQIQEAARIGIHHCIEHLGPAGPKRIRKWACYKIAIEGHQADLIGASPRTDDGKA